MEMYTKVATDAGATAQLACVLDLVEEGMISCSAKTHKPSAASVRLLSAALPGGDFYPGEPISAFAWPLLIQSGGLADGTRLRLTARGVAARRKDPHEVLLRLWERWIRGGIIDEFSRIEAVKGQRTPNTLSAVRRRRQSVAVALSLLRPREWLGVDRLFAMMQQEGIDPAVHRNEMALWKLYIVDAQYGSFGYDGAYSFALLDGRYTLAVLFEYAATLGLIDVRYTDAECARDDFRGMWGSEDLLQLSRYDGLREVRLTALGARAWGHK